MDDKHKKNSSTLKSMWVHIKTPMKCYYTSTWITLPKRQKIINVDKGIKNQSCHRNVNRINYFGKEYICLFKKLNMNLWYNPEILVLSIYKEKWNVCLQKASITNVHSNMVQNSHGVDVTPTLCTWWVGEHTMAYEQNGVQRSHKRKQIADVYYNMSEPENYSAKWKEKKKM